ncbi:MBL fold metallo-hydrolase [Arenibacter sp. GZD96]|uniref:MBL fold metallo-hydrolase n=1 Tax=Aurantibrevibacter litoralis TaxID=3106030 RepID=UPI002AFF66FE|nr:MBL fold metallo-hydrolase [Arenibacter sp. GZD-96]MEA1786281.1 MBL fold metallo-hydrolase [Arenibacter sp. GZD-96]
MFNRNLIAVKEVMYSLFIVLTLMACKENKKDTADVGTPSNEVSAPDPEVADIKIIPIAHATAIVEWENLTIYIDPTGGETAFEGQRIPDLILITDIHGDHFNLETLEALNTQKAKIIVPPAVAEKMPDTFVPQIDVLQNGETKERYGITVEAIPMYNLREDALQFHTKGRGNGYVLTIGGQRIYFSGDTEDIPEMRALKNIDKAFVCMNLPYTMTVQNAADAVLEFKPKQIYPYHYRGNPDVSNVAEFKTLVNAGNAAIEVVQLDWYPGESY